MNKTTTSHAVLETALSGAARAIGRDKRLNVAWQAGAMPSGVNVTQQPTLRMAPPPTTHDAQTMQRLRGEVDLAALSRRYHQQSVHARERPSGEKQSAIFDALEQMRVMLLGSQIFAGVAHNIDARMAHYYSQQGYANLSPLAEPPMGDILAVMLRQAVTGAPPPQSMEALLRHWQPYVMQQAASSLDALRDSLGHQASFAKHVRQLLIHLSSGDDATATGDASELESAESVQSEALDEQNETESLGALAGEEQPEDEVGGGDDGEQPSAAPEEQGDQEAGRKQRETRTGHAAPQT
ncbi:MAG: hypothetical protein K2Q12_08615, partial [Rickettsiales bacterium]|nr:hypothetical protein [Rickettsiales bacterium]